LVRLFVEVIFCMRIANFAKNFLILKTPLIDIHAHGDAEPGVVRIKNLFPEKVGEALDHARESALFSVGIHPWYIKETPDFKGLENCLNDLAAHSKVLAIGEAGLDKVAKTPWSWQEKVFNMQISLSEKLGKPMIIHCVKAWQEVLKTRKNQKAAQPWIMHGFNGSAELADQFLGAGCYLSFGEFLFRENSKAARFFPALNKERIFLETDDSGLSIQQVYEQAMRLKGLSMEELRETLNQNFKTVFGGKA